MNDYTEIFSADESGASDSWQWIVSLTRNDGQSYRLLVYQVLWDSTDENEGACYELSSFSTGADLNWHGTAPKGTHLVLGKEVTFADPATTERPNS